MDFFKQRQLDLEKGKRYILILCSINVLYRLITLFIYGISTRLIMSFIVFTAIMVGIVKGKKLAKWLFFVFTAIDILMIFRLFTWGMIQGMYAFEVLINVTLLGVTVYALLFYKPIVLYFESANYSNNFESKEKDDSDDFYKNLY